MHVQKRLSCTISRRLSALVLQPPVIPATGISLPSVPYHILSFHPIHVHQQLMLQLSVLFSKLKNVPSLLVLSSAPRAPADISGWTLCSHRRTTHIKRTDKGSASLARLSTCHLLNWNVKRTLVDRVDMTTPRGGDASEKQCTGGSPGTRGSRNHTTTTKNATLGQMILFNALGKEGCGPHLFLLSIDTVHDLVLFIFHCSPCFRAATLCCAFIFICVKDKREVWGHVTEFRVTVATRFQGFLQGNLILGPAYEMI